MGHRERLLDGAKRCIYEIGYGRTTARDLVEVSGTNLGSIGYHFGSKEALLDEAMMEGVVEWSRELERILHADVDEEASPEERFESMWTRIIESFEAHRPALIASFEAFVRAEHAPDLRDRISAAHEVSRLWLAELTRKLGGTSGEEPARAVGSFYLALLNGLMVQWTLDPDRAPSGHDISEALSKITKDWHPTK